MPVRPRDAASLVLFRGPADRPHVLMGRRAQSLRFMPGFYVFPGGTVDETDRPASNALPLHAGTADSLARHAAPEMYRALVWAAVRETWEETGLFYGDPADWPLPDGGCEAAAAFHEADVRPATDRLEFFARAVTPEEVPIRFDSRFFLADGTRAIGEIRSSGELEDVAWHRAEFVLAAFPMAHITRFVLARALAIWCKSDGRNRPHEPKDRPIARFTQRGDRFSMQEDAPGDPPQIDPAGLDWP